MSNRLKLIRQRANRRQRAVPIVTDGRTLERIEAVDQELDRLASEHAPAAGRLNSKPKPASAEVQALEAERERLYDAAAETTLWIALESLQRSIYIALVNQHPPRKDDGGKVLPTDVWGVNAETFAVPLIRACIAGYRETEDGETLPIDQETVDWLLGTDDEPGFATDRQVAEMLFLTALELNRGTDAAPLLRRRSPTETSADE